MAQTPSLQQVLDVVEDLWPTDLAEDWDAVGLVAGRRDSAVRKIHFAVDPVSDVVNEACSADADLLITHHPLLLRGSQVSRRAPSKVRSFTDLSNQGAPC